MLNVTAERRNGDFVAVYTKVQVAEDLLHSFFWNVSSEEAIGPFSIQMKNSWLIAGVVNIDNAINYFTCTQHFNQLAGTHDRWQTVLWVQTFFKTAGGFGSHTKFLCGNTNRASFKACRFKYYSVGSFVDAAVLAAHNTSNCRSFFCICNNQHIFGQVSFYSVQSGQSFTAECVADNDLVSFYIFNIECVHWLTVLEHNVVCDIYDIVDWTNTACTKSFSHPTWGWSDLNIFYNTCNVSLTEFFVLNLYRKIIVDIAAAAFYNRCVQVDWFIKGNCNFSCQTDNRQAVRTVWCDFKLNAGIIAADCGSDVLTWFAVFLNQEDAILDCIWEITFCEVELTQRTHHAVRHNTSELAFGNFNTIWQF